MVSTEVEDFRFSLIDYFIFGSMIVLSAAIGIYFGYFRKSIEPDVSPDEPPKPKTKMEFGSFKMREYLLGSRTMHPFPVAMSLVASYISAVTVISTPAEIYNYGTQYWLIIVPITLMGVIVAKVFLPVYHTLGITSSYQYLALRFHPHMTTFAAVMFLIDEIFFLPVIVYGPALAFNQVSGVSIYVVTSIVCISCTIYTLLGGMKAVVSTDAWQTVVMFLSIFIIVLYGTIAQGGVRTVLETNAAGDRLELFNFSPSLYARHTFWSTMIGGLSYWTSFNAVNQTMVQRYMAVSSLKRAQCTVAIFVLTLVLFISLCCFGGLLIHARYYECDPLTAGLIKQDDQLFPVYVMQVMGHLKGMAGIFMAGVVGAALSSLSVVLNSTAAIFYEDILKGFFKLDLSANTSSVVVKITIVVLAVLTFSLAFIVEKLGSLLRTATSLSSIAASTTFGLFSLGMLIPWSNTIGAFIGGLAGFFITAWTSFGTQYVSSQDMLPSMKLPVQTSGCEGNFTVVTTVEPDIEYVFPLYRITYLWASPLGVATVIIVGTVASFITGATNLKTLDRNLITPGLHRWLPKSQGEDENAVPLS